ncbi:MAG TPA: transporter [Terriglobia bacterium]
MVVLLSCGGTTRVLPQQKPQWMPGQVGLNAGILPSPGFTYVDMNANYDAGAFDGPNGKALPVTGSYNVWAIENIFDYVPNKKVLGGNLGFMIIFPTIASGSLVADIQVPTTGSPNLSLAGGGAGLADLWVQPFTLGWHLKRWDLQVADGFMVPTGRYSPGATNNVGSGYFGNHFQTGTTFYITKNKGTSANLFTDWEVHGSRQGTNGTSKTPGQAFTDEWGIGQILPLRKDFSKLLQLGMIGYDQWQVTANGGTIPVPLPDGTIIAGARQHTPLLLGPRGGWST